MANFTNYTSLLERAARFLKKPMRLSTFAALLSLFTLLAFHYPFFHYVATNVEPGFNSVLIFISLILLMLALNFFAYYLFLFLGRIVGKCIVAFTFIADAVSLYFINTFDTFLTNKMMGNVFNTRYSEASGFFSWSLIWYVVLLGIIPCIYLFMQRVDYGKWKRFFGSIGISLGLSILIALLNISNWTWIDRNSTKLGSIVMPWSYTVNSIRWWNGERERNRKEIKLPDAVIASPEKDVCILIIGESGRRANFSLYGYDRPTNPLLEKDSVTALTAESAATYTTAGVKAILDHKPSKKLYEILPNYLYRNGVDVIWRSNNWGQPPLHIKKYADVPMLRKMYPDADSRYDGILLEGLRDSIATDTVGKMLIVLHTNTSHGPTYNLKYPAEFEKFKPVCTTVEMSKADPQELMNAYDNTILYTDYLVHSAIEMLRSVPDRRGAVIYVSDHGESLGEGGLYMHGVPMSVAPKVQTEIPFIVWTNDSTINIDARREASQYNVFHSVLGFLGIESPVYDPDLDLFRPSDETSGTKVPETVSEK